METGPDSTVPDHRFSRVPFVLSLSSYLQGRMAAVDTHATVRANVKYESRSEVRRQ